MMTETPNPRPGQIVPAALAGKPRAPHVAHAAIWVLAGGLMSTIAPLVGPCLMAYGVREFVSMSRLKGLALATVEGIVLAVAAGFIDVAFATAIGVELIIALGTVWCMRDRQATVLGVTAVITVASLVNLAADGAILAAAGESLAVRSPETLMAIARTSVGTGIDEDLFLSSLAPVIKLLWPLIQYVMVAAIDVAAAGLGSQMMAVRLTGDPRMPRIAAFRAPLWSVVILAVFAAVFFGAGWGIPYAQAVRTTAATIVMSVRIIFAIQGFGVLFAQFERFRLGCVTQTLLIVVALWVEMPFFLFSIIGLIDVWANFRGLSREAHTSGNAR